MAVSAILGVLRILPQRLAFALVPPLTTLVWWLNPGWRRTSMRNMEIFFKGQPLGAPENRRQRYRLGLRAAIQFGYHCFEFGRMGFLPVEKTLAMVEEVEGLEYMQNALALGHGVIGLGVHYSNWELPGIYLAQKVAPVYGLGKEQKDPFFTNLLFPRRERYGMRNIAANNKMTSGILRALQEGAIFGILADQNGGSTGVFVPFAGTLASTGPGPAALALKTGAPIIPTFTRRIKPGRVKLYFKPPIDTSNLPAEKQAAILELLTRVNAAYETVIREDPTLWLWGHKRWKTRPPGEPPLY